MIKPMEKALSSKTAAQRCRRCGGISLGQELCPGCLLRDGLEESGSADGPRSSPGMSSAPAPEPGSVIDGYEILNELGRGGMGVVYLADQTRPVRRRVALKLIKLGMDTRQVIGRFEAERQALARMDHPSVAKVLAAGASDAGRPYFVMELVRGPRITDYSDEHQLSTRERLELFLQVCRAIQHAHQKGILHRDIKPSNILVTQQDGLPVPKVIDFGIAKAIDGVALSDKTVVTTAEQFLGTPAYTSPEQADGSADIDTRTDIYSLGVLLYELLTGKTPFDSDDLLRSGWEVLRRTLRDTEPQSPSTRLTTLAPHELGKIAGRRRMEPNRLIHAVRGDLDWIVMKCLEKERSRRYATCSDLAHDLECHLQHEPVVARPPTRFYRFQKLVRRNRLMFMAGATVFFALIASLGMVSWSLVREKESRDAALSAQERAEAAEARSEIRERAARDSEAEARAELNFFTQSQITRKLLPHARQADINVGASLNEAVATNEPALKAAQKAAALDDAPTNAVESLPSPVVSPANGATYAQWAAAWDQWLLELPLTNAAGAIHPILMDSPMYDITEGQGPEVWFLAAPFGTVQRQAIVPPDKWLFFPLLSAEASTLEDITFFGATAEDQAAIARSFIDHAYGLFCEIDGVPVSDIQSYRVTSPQITFTAPTPWIFGQVGGVGTSTQDGYFILLRPLGSGYHVLHFGGAFLFRRPADPFDLYAPIDMTYNLTIP